MAFLARIAHCGRFHAVQPGEAICDGGEGVQESGVRSQESGVRSQESGVKKSGAQESGVRRGRGVQLLELKHL